uniref:Isopropylmalate dehydrogenase-like domain-containing protein n=1 Tax=Paramormyrops kingsleyae TaxID=1676925 RepID=A0A3B3RSU7_9TELE
QMNTAWLSLRSTCLVTVHYTAPWWKLVIRYTVILIPGDGIGPELLNHVCDLFRSVKSMSVKSEVYF